MAEQYQAVSALDGRVIKSYPVTSASEISGQMTAARLAANTWAAYSVAERVKILLALQTVILANVDAITDTLVDVTGKVKTEALLGEIYPVLELLRYYQKHAQSILAPCQVSTSPLAFPNASAQYERRPYGVVA
ncbi:MAG: aldehyde dehydrogenase family protein, partial [Methylobacter sp.]|nr:aldehyde dehydrogenase family protein [Methylobacter sp.]